MGAINAAPSRRNSRSPTTTPSPSTLCGNVIPRFAMPYSSAAALFRKLSRAACLLMLAGGPLRAAPDDSLATRRPVSFSSGGYRLHGELVAPRTAAGRRPAVVFLVGSGTSSYRTNYRSFLRDNLETPLLAQGVALLYFDKPGLGQSEGRWAGATFADRAADARAALAFLAAQPGIDSTRLAVVGHSQGGWIAQMMAARYPAQVRCAVSLAGASYPVRRQLLGDYYNQNRCQGLDSARAWRRAGHQTNRAFAVAWLLPVREQWAHLRRIRRFDPAADLRRVQRPLLLLVGEHDELVDPTWTQARLHEVLGPKLPPNVRYQTIAGADHSFQLAPRCHAGSRKQFAYATAFQQALSGFLREELGR